MARISNLCSLGLSLFLVVLLATDLVLCQPGENRNRGRKHKRGRGNNRRNGNGNENGNGNGNGQGRPQYQMQYTPPAPTYPATVAQQDLWGHQQQGGLMPPVPLPAPKLAAPRGHMPQGPAAYPNNFGHGMAPAATGHAIGGPAASPISYNPRAFSNQDCFLLMDAGNCPVDRIVYYYDMKSQTCKPFWYGCNGNENRYESYYSCMDSCAPVPQFPLPKQPTIHPMQQGHQIQQFGQQSG